ASLFAEGLLLPAAAAGVSGCASAAASNAADDAASAAFRSTSALGTKNNAPRPESARLATGRLDCSRVIPHAVQYPLLFHAPRPPPPLLSASGNSRNAKRSAARVTASPTSPLADASASSSSRCFKAAVNATSFAARSLATAFAWLPRAAVSPAAAAAPE
ncbi:unnamed protein product, partial [Ectocarpus sp. 13 AM-2016]